MGLQHPELFAWVAGFSSAAPHEALDETLEPLKPMWSQSPLRMLWVGCGKEDFLLERNQVFIQWLEQHGMAHEWVLTEGGMSGGCGGAISRRSCLSCSNKLPRQSS